MDRQIRNIIFYSKWWNTDIWRIHPIYLKSGIVVQSKHLARYWTKR